MTQSLVTNALYNCLITTDVHIDLLRLLFVRYHAWFYLQMITSYLWRAEQLMIIFPVWNHSFFVISMLVLIITSFRLIGGLSLASWFHWRSVYASHVNHSTYFPTTFHHRQSCSVTTSQLLIVCLSLFFYRSAAGYEVVCQPGIVGSGVVRHTMASLFVDPP